MKETSISQIILNLFISYMHENKEAILLFGKDNSIMSVLPQHKTDAIFRVENKDRYDDRAVVITNLIDSYDRLIEFGQKHLNDLFVLDGIVNVNARDRILREIVSNTLAHRDYSSGYPAKMIIDDEKITVENSNLAHGMGTLDLQKFEPAELKVASLLVKPGNMQVKLDIDYTCFEIPNDFIVGYGLDYDGFGRNLSSIYTVVED